MALPPFMPSSRAAWKRSTTAVGEAGSVAAKACPATQAIAKRPKSHTGLNSLRPMAGLLKCRYTAAQNIANYSVSPARTRLQQPGSGKRIHRGPRVNDARTNTFHGTDDGATGE